MNMIDFSQTGVKVEYEAMLDQFKFHFYTNVNQLDYLRTIYISAELVDQHSNLQMTFQFIINGLQKSLSDKFSTGIRTDLLYAWTNALLKTTYFKNENFTVVPPISNTIISGKFSIGHDYNAPIIAIGATPSIAKMAKTLPGVDTQIKMSDVPDCDCYSPKGQMPLYECVIHLNDHHKMSRDKIADWVDHLHDAGIINAEFQTKE